MSNGAQIGRTQSSFVTRQKDDLPQLTRAQSLDMSKDLALSVDALYNQAVHYHQVDKNIELAESAFRAALRVKGEHVQSLLGLGSLLREVGREEEGTELLHSECVAHEFSGIPLFANQRLPTAEATGLIMCPHMLPGEEKLRSHAMHQHRSGSSKNVVDAKSSSETHAPMKPPVRMGSMKQVLAMQEQAGKIKAKEMMG